MCCKKESHEHLGLHHHAVSRALRVDRGEHHWAGVEGNVELGLSGAQHVHAADLAGQLVGGLVLALKTCGRGGTNFGQIHSRLGRSLFLLGRKITFPDEEFQHDTTKNILC